MQEHQNGVEIFDLFTQLRIQINVIVKGENINKPTFL